MAAFGPAMTIFVAQTHKSSPSAILPWVQALRAFAALCVAFTHIAHDAIANGADPRGWLSAVQNFFPWDAGVDIFFVISGFVIVHASSNLFAAKGGAKTFLRRRLTRIVPLYWLTTALFLLVLWRAGGAIHGVIGGPAYIIASFLFIPWKRPDGIMQPAFGLGWTLNYEMFFYLVLACCMRLRRGTAVRAAAAALIALIALHKIFNFANPQLGFWSSPITLEFCAGMVLAQARAAGFSLGLPARILLPLTALAILHFCAHAAPQFRPLAFGLPALLLAAGAALAPTQTTISRTKSSLVRLGDASYALYLIHPFIMRGLTISWHKIHAQTELAGTTYVFVGLVAAQCCALLVNVTFERRAMNWLRRRAGGQMHEIV